MPRRRQFRVTIFERGEMDGHWVQRLKWALINRIDQLFYLLEEGCARDQL